MESLWPFILRFGGYIEGKLGGSRLKGSVNNGGFRGSFQGTIQGLKPKPPQPIKHRNTKSLNPKAQ